MPKKKVRATRHNGRVGKHGVFKPGHNDRTFDVDNADHIDPSRSYMNVYWDMYQGYNIADANGIRPERKFNFEEIEAAFYLQKFGDSVDAQTERHEKSRHRERIRTMDQIRVDEKTCPEETVYQLGTKDGHEDPALFAQVVAELFEEFQKRFSTNIQILDWALHMDESTPHIHERHVFFADDGYGMSFPKQEKACKELGFERPFPDKKPSKHNNAKMSFDEEVRRLYIEIAEKYGVVIEKIPLEGKKHLEKNDYILAKQQEEISARQAAIDELISRFEKVDEISGEVARTAYKKACDVVTETVTQKTVNADIGIISKYRDDITATTYKANANDKKIYKKVLNTAIALLKRKLGEIAVNVGKQLTDPRTKATCEDEIAKATKQSVIAQLHKMKEEVVRQTEMRKSTEPEKDNKNKGDDER